ncbi:MAG: 1-deoxy-D-xylulose-5-phosphate synthase [Puniceicoccales bacterium]|jgi:1-deoxy-D-xylulose-5-phosphate synthase|nr:1-deoxy-D-xylulose-5-phosphate synthase [Puniceicoccales bacterium]
MTKSLLERIGNPNDLRALSYDDLTELAADIRSKLVEVTHRNGGHLASNLGVVELSIAIHRVFDSPRDKILFDISHQSYVHKLLTGRNGEQFLNIRQSNGYSGFCNPEESAHDSFCTGHAGTALSAALGLCKARNCLNQQHKVAAVLGDGALTCGPTMEALNNINADVRQLLIILNDNDYSIDRNIGAMAIYLNKIILSRWYSSIQSMSKILRKHRFGLALQRMCRRLKFVLKGLLLPSSFFEHFGLRYIGPIDGHNLMQLEEYLKFCRIVDYPILLHVKTTKGKGSSQASANPESFHKIDPTASEERKTSMRDIFGQTVVELARVNKKIIGVTSAMAGGTGMSYLRDYMPQRCIDVGIAEEHAVTLCAGLAKGGMLPICAIYSTFMQRAFDQIFHDICLQHLPVIFCLDRAGLSANDGPTHHGLFDISYLRCLPNAIIMQPKNSAELSAMLHAALEYEAPVFIRYNSTYTYKTVDVGPDIVRGHSEILRRGEDICLIGLGYFIDVAHRVNALLGGNCTIINARFAKPIDGTTLSEIVNKHDTIVTMEDNVLAGGFGSGVLEFYGDSGIEVRVIRIGWPDCFIEHGSNEESIRKAHGLNAEAVALHILEQIAQDGKRQLRAKI